MKRKTAQRSSAAPTKTLATEYNAILSELVDLLENARRSAARAVNSIMTATYWEFGRRIVEIEQRGRTRKDYYGEQLLERLAEDLTKRFGRGLGLITCNGCGCSIRYGTRKRFKQHCRVNLPASQSS